MSKGQRRGVRRPKQRWIIIYEWPRGDDRDLTCSTIFPSTAAARKTIEEHMRSYVCWLLELNSGDTEAL